jgi:hypothetical protein
MIAAAALEATTRTRAAANAAAIAVVAFAVLFVVTTQVGAVREVSPFADDPFDLIASYAAVFLPLVAGATWVRSLAHRGARLPARIARRIVLGSAIAVAIVASSVLADVVAIVATPGWAKDTNWIGALVVVLVIVAAVCAASAAVLLGRAVEVLRRPVAIDYDTVTEPDVVDDALKLAVEVADVTRLRGIRRPVALVSHFFERSSLSPRRHRAVFGIVLALASAVAFVVWHEIREGPWASPVAALIFGLLPAIGILVIYLLTLRPLRLLRAARD